MNYSAQIKALRIKMLLTQREFAELLGVSFETVNRWENGKFEPTMKIKRRLSDLFSKYQIVTQGDQSWDS